MGDGRILTVAMSQNLHLPTELLLRGAAHGRGGSGQQPKPARAAFGQNARTATGRVALLRGRFRIPQARAPVPASFPKATAAPGGDRRVSDGMGAASGGGGAVARCVVYWVLWPRKDLGPSCVCVALGHKA